MVNFLFLIFGSHFVSFRVKRASESEDIPQLQMPPYVPTTKTTFYKMRKEDERQCHGSVIAPTKSLHPGPWRPPWEPERGKRGVNVCQLSHPYTHWWPAPSQILISQNGIVVNFKFLFLRRLENKGNTSSSMLLLPPCLQSKGVDVSWMKECGF